jgi:hypothetical protein
MTDIIQSLWEQHKLPIIDGIYKSNGLYYKLSDGKVVIAELSQKDYSKWYSKVSITAEIEHQGVTYHCGEGSYGSDGYVIAIRGEVIEWLFFGDINPIERIWIESGEIHALNNCKAEWVIPVSEPQEAFIKTGTI